MIKNKIPLCKPSILQKDIKILNDVIKSGWLAHGKYNEIFEKSFAKYIGTKYAISLNSCTSALELALWAYDIKGDVIIPSFTWVSTANVVKLSGCNPVFVDVEINSRNLNLDKIKKKITKKTKALIVVHFGGYPIEDIELIYKFCKKNKILLIEDSAECIGGSINGVKTGSLGIGCFSFYPAKNLTTCEGGMLTTNNKKIYKKIKALSAHGIQTSTYEREKKGSWYRNAHFYGRNFRMPNPLAALGFQQLKRRDEMNKDRNKIAKIYDKGLSNKKNIEIQVLAKGVYHSYQMYTILIKNIDKKELIKKLNKEKIMVSSHFDPPVHLQKAYYSYKKNRLPNTNYISKKIITLPMYPNMTVKDANKVVQYILRYTK